MSCRTSSSEPVFSRGGRERASRTAHSGEPRAWIVYDGQCPFCSRYVQLVRLREALAEVRLIDARKGGGIVEELERAGVDLDEGMVLKLDGRLYHGHNCIHGSLC